MPRKPQLTIMAGQPVLNLELVPDEGYVLVELGATPEMGRIAARLYMNASVIEVGFESSEQAAGMHLSYLRVALDERFEVTSYEAGVIEPPDNRVVLRKTSGGETEVSGRVFMEGEMDLAVGLNKDGELVKTAIWTNDDYADAEVGNKERLRRDARLWGAKIGRLAEDAMMALNFAAFAEEIRKEPDVAGLLAVLAAGVLPADGM